MTPSLIATIAAVLVVGCGGAPKTPEPPHRPGIAILAEYEFYGGVGGLQDRLVVWADGRAALSPPLLDHPRRFRVAPREMKTLRTLRRAEFDTNGSERVEESDRAWVYLTAGGKRVEVGDLTAASAGEVEPALRTLQEIHTRERRRVANRIDRQLKREGQGP